MVLAGSEFALFYSHFRGLEGGKGRERERYVMGNKGKGRMEVKRRQRKKVNEADKKERKEINV